MKILVHYGELALKGKNRIFFEKKLVENIKRAFKGEVRVERLFGRFLLETELGPEKTQDKLLKVFGLAWFAEYEETKDLAGLKKLLAKIPQKDFKTFAVRVNRVNKSFPKTSMQLEKEIGEFVRKKHSKKVDLSSPDITFWVEILSSTIKDSKGKYEDKSEMVLDRHSRILLFTKKIKGLQGLPVGVSGKLVSLLSGGIDSPVASYLMMKRGAALNAVHFHSFPYLDKSSINKCQEILEVLREYQPDIKLHLVPFFAIQKKLKLEIDNRYLVVFYRRMMLRICQEIAKKEKAGGLVTGESLGQVASQTLENLGVTNEAVVMPVLRPLVGLDKQEISDLAQKIGTYEISIKPQKDCCTLFIPKHPVTKACLEKVLMMEKKLKLQNLLQQALKETEIV